MKITEAVFTERFFFSVSSDGFVFLLTSYLFHFLRHCFLCGSFRYELHSFYSYRGTSLLISLVFFPLRMFASFWFYSYFPLFILFLLFPSFFIFIFLYFFPLLNSFLYLYHHIFLISPDVLSIYFNVSLSIAFPFFLFFFLY